MLPPRSFYSVHEVAARWSVMPFDVVGWSIEGLLSLSIALQPVKAGQSDMISGLVGVEAPHVLPLFRRDGAPSATVVIRQIRTLGQEVRWITDPAEGVMITAADVLVKRTEVERFEAQHGIFGSPRQIEGGRRSGGPGVPPRYDWDAFYAALTRRIHENGVPATQAELVREMLAWFEDQDIDRAPDESTVKRKVTVVWRELNRA